MRFIRDLSQETINILRRINKESKNHRVRQRAHCILLSYQGYSTTELVRIFNVNLLTIYNWFDAWESKRLVGLYDRKGKGRKSKLTDEHKEKIREWAKAFPKNLNKIRALVKEEFEISVSKKTIKRLLKSMKFSWHRIRKKVNGEPDPIEYEEKKEALEELKKQDKEGVIDLYYFDESGFCLEPYVPYAWQELNDPIKIETSKSKRLNVLGFMNLHNDLKAYGIEGSVDSAVVIACVDDFCKDLKKKTVIAIDNAPTHTSKAFEAKIPEWKEKNLEIFKLPTYSPELNLIEILWRFIKYEWIEFDAYKSWKHLVEYVENVVQKFGEEYIINFG